MRRLRAATITLTCALALLGCSDDSDQPGDSRSTWTPTATPESPSTTAVSDPTVAPKNETARQFIRRWVELGNHMQATGETAGFLAVAGPDCESCHDFAKKMGSIYARGGHVTGGDERIVAFKRESATQWVITRASSPTEYKENRDGPVKTFAGGTYRSRLYLAKVDGKWIVGFTEGVPA